MTSLLEVLPPYLQHYGAMYLQSVSPNESSLPDAVLVKERNTEAKAPSWKKKNQKTDVKGASSWKSTTLELTGASRAIKLYSSGS